MELIEPHFEEEKILEEPRPKENEEEKSMISGQNQAKETLMLSIESNEELLGFSSKASRDKMDKHKERTEDIESGLVATKGSSSQKNLISIGHFCSLFGSIGNCRLIFPLALMAISISLYFSQLASLSIVLIVCSLTVVVFVLFSLFPALKLALRNLRRRIKRSKALFKWRMPLSTEENDDIGMETPGNQETKSSGIEFLVEDSLKKSQGESEREFKTLKSAKFNKNNKLKAKGENVETQENQEMLIQSTNGLQCNELGLSNNEAAQKEPQPIGIHSSSNSEQLLSLERDQILQEVSERNRRREALDEMRHEQNRVVRAFRKISQLNLSRNNMPSRESLNLPENDGDFGFPYLLQMIQMQENEESSGVLEHWIQMNSENSAIRATGMSDEEIMMIPPFKLGKLEENPDSNGNEENCCSVCFAPFEENSLCKRLSCEHFFHDACVSKWLRISKKCPICKKPHVNM